MFLRISRVKQKNGVAEYVQLAHNEHDTTTGRAKAKILYHFGRKDELDMDALRRLVHSISRFFDPQEAAAMVARVATPEAELFAFLGSRQLGGAWLLDGLWRRLEIDVVLCAQMKGRGLALPMERLLFGLVADRALAPSSKLAMEHWVKNEVAIRDLPEVEVHQLYRAMDFLLDAHAEIQKAVFFRVANLLNLEVDLIFLDTTTTYFEVGGEDADTIEADGETVAGLRKRGYSKDNHPELAQVVIAFAVTRTGIPVRCWVWPGNTSDQAVVEEVKADLNGWQLGRVVTVADAGFNSAQNRRILQQAGGQYIVGEKLHNSKGAPADVLSSPGRFRTLASLSCRRGTSRTDEDSSRYGLAMKEVIVDADSPTRRRFVIVRNPDEAKRDKLKRDDIVAEVERRLAAAKQHDGKAHEKAICELRAHAVFGRYVKQTPTGRVTLNREKITAEEHLDGKFLISSSDERLSAEDLVMGYKQLWAVERVFRDLKHTIDIRPVYHRLADRIKAHVLLCWLALLLIRVAENETKQTWRQIRQTLSTLQLGIHRVADGETRTTTPLTPDAKALFAALGLVPPPRVMALPTPATRLTDKHNATIQERLFPLES